MNPVIDWPGIRANAIAVGVRAAARQAAADLSDVERTRFVERVMKRSAREGWITRKTQIQAAVRLSGSPGQSGAHPIPLSANVRTAPDSLATALAEDSNKTKIGLSKAALSAATAFSERTGDQVIEDAQAFRHIVAGSSTLHGWEERKDHGLTLNLGVAIGGME